MSRNGQIFPRGSAGNPTYYFNPGTISGLKFWYDVTQITGASDGDAIGTWPDESGNAFDLTQSTGSQKPTYKTAIQNGKPILRFSHSSSSLMTNTSNLGTIKSVFAVAKYSASTFASYDGLVNPDSGGANIVFSGNSGGTTWYGTLTNYYLNGTSTSNDANVNHWNVYATTGSSGSDFSSGIIVSQDRTNSGRSWEGDIAEIIGYDNVLSDADRESVIQYLGDKWGITVA